MKLYKVTDVDGVDLYFQFKREADAYFNHYVRKMNDNYMFGDSVSMSKVKVVIDAETVLALLNGSGGYIVEEVPIKSVKAEEPTDA